VPRHFRALFEAHWEAPWLGSLQMPVLVLRGSATRAPAARVAELLAAALPQAQCRTLAGAGHRGPITHAPMVAHWMASHIDPLLTRSSAAQALAA
jgi:pimeloyl-ACP methyl ester carboxylesterase